MTPLTLLERLAVRVAGHISVTAVSRHGRLVGEVFVFQFCFDKLQHPLCQGPCWRPGGGGGVICMRPSSSPGPWRSSLQAQAHRLLTPATKLQKLASTRAPAPHQYAWRRSRPATGVQAGGDSRLAGPGGEHHPELLSSCGSPAPAGNLLLFIDC